jgi:hypothetical protein
MLSRRRLTLLFYRPIFASAAALKDVVVARFFHHGSRSLLKK